MGWAGCSGQQCRLERSGIRRHRYRPGQVAAHHRDQPVLGDCRDPSGDTRHERGRRRGDRVHRQRCGVRPDQAGRLRRVEGGDGGIGPHHGARTRPPRHQIQHRVPGPGDSRRARSDWRIQPVGGRTGCGFQSEADRLHAQGHATAKADHRRRHRTCGGVVQLAECRAPSHRPADLGQRRLHDAEVAGSSVVTSARTTTGPAGGGRRRAAGSAGCPRRCP